MENAMLRYTMFCAAPAEPERVKAFEALLTRPWAPAVIVKQVISPLHPVGQEGFVLVNWREVYE